MKTNGNLGEKWDSITRSCVGKPILIFVSTRKGVFSTAEVLAKAYKEGEGKRAKAPWSRPSRIDACFNDQRLAEFAAIGIGVHHAGLETQDRKTIEGLYIQKRISVLVATSTLAVGVNLPAHFVIIKGVQLYQNGASSEYSDLDIMQMMGRAGRPQYDTEGIALIMCEQELVAKYQALSQGSKVLESCLHRNLSEHVNSEIGMGTITDIESAKRWLRDSFLYQRLRKNPNYYAIGDDQRSADWQDRMDDIVLANIRKLQDHDLVKECGDGTKETLATTEYGEIMSKFYIRQATVSSFTILSPAFRGYSDQAATDD
ncbi:hypothetical protein EST38_g3524 [Candolleomyces aberdarensis]|uniref:DNA 3'-5' helicase n=1 Tax=Candolleomyces aberdarensis TaxID=2316362 RepID=A0A4Q2DTC8_9AGAR|nr:hypothetical protein EST38_g3524 [Candolleomyces aberdarensis]